MMYGKNYNLSGFAQIPLLIALFIAASTLTTGIILSQNKQLGINQEDDRVIAQDYNIDDSINTELGDGEIVQDQEQNNNILKAGVKEMKVEEIEEKREVGGNNEDKEVKEYKKNEDDREDVIENDNIVIEESTPWVGSGTKEDPYKISTSQDLIALSDNSDHWKDCFVVTDNITMDSTTSFMPIAKHYSFEGDFNGNGKIINELYINSSEDEVGLFAHINGANIYDLGLTNVNINGSDHVGGLVGTITNGGKILNSYTTGIIVNEGNLYTGGLAGANFDGTISDSYSSAIVKGNNEVGGLAGQNRGIISNSYASGDVFGNNMVGGLVGLNHKGTISNSYVTGNVNFKGNIVGGLVGENSGGTINTSYATGKVVKEEEPMNDLKKASGTIRVYNTNANDLHMIKGTRFLLNNSDLAYRSKMDFVTPGTMSNGNVNYVDVQVEADDFGNEYNLEGAKGFSLPGLKNTDYYETTWGELLYGEKIFIED